MKFVIDTRSTEELRDILHGVFQPGQAATAMERGTGQLIRRGLAVVLSALMIVIPVGQGAAFAQSAPSSSDAQPAPAIDNAQPTADANQTAPQLQPLTADQLNQLVAPIALYPDALVAQVLAAATYPTQVVEADRWLQAQGNAAPDADCYRRKQPELGSEREGAYCLPYGSGADGQEPSVDHGPGQCLLQPASGRDGFRAGDAPEGAGCGYVAQHAAADGNRRDRPNHDCPSQPCGGLCSGL